MVVTHQLRDAYYVATHTAQFATNGQIEFLEAPEKKMDEAEFMMLKDGDVDLRRQRPRPAGVDRPVHQEFLVVVPRRLSVPCPAPGTGTFTACHAHGRLGA